jgi:hypothetical protein
MTPSCTDKGIVLTWKCGRLGKCAMKKMIIFFCKKVIGDGKTAKFSKKW